jgi:hypothetical protein
LESDIPEIPLPVIETNPLGLKRELKLTPLKKYEVPLEKLPKHLMGKVKKQFMLEYLIPEEIIQIAERTITIEEHMAYEHSYE